jgi:hypothetical protein
MIEIIIILSIILICIMLTTSKEIKKNERYIHSSIHNRSFFIDNYTDTIISDIQLSLNKRDNIYKIILKDKYYLLKNNEIINIIESC